MVLALRSEQAEEAPHEERKFLVFESNLRELLAFCRVCHKRCRNEFKVVGSMLHVTSSCPHHTETWQSQPLVGNKPAGNVLLAAAILFSGCTVATFLRALKSINVQTVHERTFFNYQRGYFLPAIKKVHSYSPSNLNHSHSVNNHNNDKYYTISLIM